MNRQKVGIEELSERLKNKGFEYIGNYTGCDGTVDVICCNCRQQKTINLITFRHQKYMHCIECKNKAKKIQQEERRKECEEERAKRKKEIAIIKQQRRKEERALLEEQKALLIEQLKKERCEAIKKEKEKIKVVCKECGALFSHADRRSNMFCSDKCAKKSNDRIKSRKRDARKRGNGKCENIDLFKLFERDKGYCHICNGLCDKTDYIYRGSTFIAGNDYPSVDHVIPLAIGGEDSWDNVKLAHRSCNAKKGARLIG